MNGNRIPAPPPTAGMVPLIAPEQNVGVEVQNLNTPLAHPVHIALQGHKNGVPHMNVVTIGGLSKRHTLAAMLLQGHFPLFYKEQQNTFDMVRRALTVADIMLAHPDTPDIIPYPVPASNAESAAPAPQANE